MNNYELTLNITSTFFHIYSLNLGRLGQAAEKQIKHHLKRTLTNIHLTYEKISTLLNQFEAILSYRRLFVISSDPLDFEPLTPSYFLIQRNITCIPFRYKYVQQLDQRFLRFSTEYISQLHHTTYKTESKFWHIQATLFLIREPNLVSGGWAEELKHLADVINIWRSLRDTHYMNFISIHIEVKLIKTWTVIML